MEEVGIGLTGLTWILVISLANVFGGIYALIFLAIVLFMVI